MTDTSFYSICVVIVDSTFYSIFLVEPTRLFLQCIQSAVSRPDLMISFWSDSGCMSDTFDKYVYRFLLVFNVI